MPGRLYTLLILSSQLLSVSAVLYGPRRVENDDTRAYQPLEALVRPVTDEYEAAARHAHFHHQDTRLSLKDQHHVRKVKKRDAAILKRQVKNPRQAATKWDHRKAKRATASNLPCTGSVGAYGQCGGIGWTGSTCCTAGFACNYLNDWYSQCQPAASTCTNAFYSQCGGIGFSGATCCPSGSACIASGPYYSSCVLGATSDIPWPSSTTTTTPAQTTTTTTTTTTSRTTTTTTTTTSTTTSKTTTTTSTTTTPTTTTTSRTTTTSSSTTTSSPTTTTTTRSTTTSTSATSTTSCARATPTCNASSGGSDGCTPYTVSQNGVTLPGGTTYPSGGHVNFQAIPCAQYSCGERYLKPGSDWTPVGFGTHFDPNLSSKKYIGASNYDFGLADSYFGASGYCIIWVQVSLYNQHYGEGGQYPVCSASCGKTF